MSPISPDSRSAASQLAGAAFRQYAADLHRFLLRRWRRPRDVDDLAQEVFMRLLRVENAELVRKPQSYLFGIASHVVYEFRLRMQQEERHVRFDSEELIQASENPSHPAADELGDRLALRQQLDLALAELPPTHRAILLLVKRDGLSHQEAAKAAGVSFHTVEKYVVEARAKLRAWKKEQQS
jgi:RNA polymerase sigma-70 factor (ECF subfamily)